MLSLLPTHLHRLCNRIAVCECAYPPQVWGDASTNGLSLPVKDLANSLYSNHQIPVFVSAVYFTTGSGANPPNVSNNHRLVL